MICMKWLSQSEICVYAETERDGHDLREVMNPYGIKAIIIQHCGLRLVPAKKGKDA